MQAVSFRNFALTVVFCGACILSFVKITLKYSVGGPGHALQHPVFNVTPTLAIGKGQNSLLPQVCDRPPLDVAHFYVVFLLGIRRQGSKHFTFSALERPKSRPHIDLDPETEWVKY